METKHMTKKVQLKYCAKEINFCCHNCNTLFIGYRTLKKNNRSEKQFKAEKNLDFEKGQNDTQRDGHKLSNAQQIEVLSSPSYKTIPSLMRMWPYKRGILY